MTDRSTFDPERWDQVERILDQILDLDSEETVRAALDSLCGEDLSLRREVEELFSLGNAEGDHLDRGVFEVVPEVLSRMEQSLDEDHEELIAGREIGAYRLVELLGRGGMGVVYRAERADQQFEQSVAIKVLPANIGGADVARRFLIERQILADLDHPAIGRLLDGGVTDEGQPYLVMELVEGVPIDEYCRSRALDLAERIELFLQVCAAVQHAHQRMVVHRDLKPSNILVTPDGRVKLLDFGIAKLLDPADAGVTMVGETVFQPRTLAFASPEQVANRPVSAASDVYSLGILLYRLLTGVAPYSLTRVTAGEAEKIIREQTPTAPSAAAARAAAKDNPLAGPSDTVFWHARLRGDLDKIILKALRKDPSRRYATVAQLAEDLRRYRAGLPVSAHRPTWSYSTHKFLARHRMGVGVALAFVLTVLAASGAALWQAARARAEASRSQHVAEVLTSLFEDVDPLSGQAREMTMEQLLDRGVGRVRRELAEDPEMRLRLLGMLGRAYRGQGHYDRAAVLHRETLNEAKTLFGADSVEVAEATFDLGQAQQSTGDFDKAEIHYIEALEIYLDRLGAETLEVADVLQYLGILASSTGDFDSAEEHHRHALRIRRALASGPEFGIAGELHGLSIALAGTGRESESMKLLEEALEIAEQTIGEDHPLTATMRSNLAIRMHTAGDYESGESLYRQALEVKERTLGSDHPDLTASLSSLGRLLMDKGDFASATLFIERAATIAAQTMEEANFQRIASEINLASLSRAIGRPQEAEPLYRSALERLVSLIGEKHAATARVRSLLAGCLLDLGRLEEAEMQARSALEMQNSLAVVPLHRAATELVLGDILVDSGRLAEAETLLTDAVEIRREALPDSSWQTAAAELGLARWLLVAGRRPEAQVLLAGALPILEDNLPAEDRRIEHARKLLDEAGNEDETK